MSDQIIAFFSLEDFASDMSVTDSPYDLVRVQPIRRVTGGKPEHSMVQWIVLVSMRTAEGIAMTSILTGQRWEIFEEDDKRYAGNAEVAAALIQDFLLDYGYTVAVGIYSPQAVMDNIVVGAGCDLWRFEEGCLVPLEENERQLD